MTIPCPQWSPSSVIGVGHCAAGKRGGRPTTGACRRCLSLPAEPPPPSPPTLYVTGRELWEQLHRRAASGRIAVAEMAFIKHLADPLARCGCRAEWAALLDRMPPDLSTPETYFAWSVAAHNEVNARLGKPILPLDDARRLYPPPERV